MGPWQIKALATTAIIVATVPVGMDVMQSMLVHPVKHGIHVQRDLPGGWVVSWSIEPSHAHPIVACEPKAGAP